MECGGFAIEGTRPIERLSLAVFPSPFVIHKTLKERVRIRHRIRAIDGQDDLNPQAATFTHGGINGATVLAKGQDWQFRLAALAKDGVIYRFIFAAQPLTADLDGLFRQSIGSFNSLSDSEREQARPLRVRHVIAQQGETAETLSKRMGTVERPYERFLVLNGLDRPALQLGRGYKLIAE